MAWTTPRTWVASEVVTASVMNTHVRDNLTYVKDVLDGVQTQSWTPRYAAGDAVGHSIVQRKARGSLGTPTIVSASDSLGTLGWAGYDGSAYREAVQLKAFVDGTPGASDMPGALSILTSADAGITLTEHWRLKQDGQAWFQDFTEGSGLLTLAGLTTQVQSTGLRIWYDSGSTRRALQFVTNGVVAMDLGRTAGGTLDAGFYHPVVFNDAVQVNNTSSTPFSIGTSSGDILTDSNANLGLNDGNLWLGDMAHNAGHGVAKVIMSDQGSPSVSPPSNHGLVWYDDAAGALKLRTDTGLIRQMLHAGCRVYHSAAQSIGSGTSTALSFNSERHDSDGFHSTSSNTNRITIPAGMGGKYVISGQVRFAANATGFREVSIRVGGATTIAIQDTLAVGGVPTILSITTVYELAAGDYVELLAYQNSGGALDVDSSGNYSPEFSIAAVG